MRDPRAGFLPVDLHRRLTKLMQETGESVPAISNRLLIALHRWTLEGRVEALKNIPWAISLDDVNSPEQAEEYLFPAVKSYKPPEKPRIPCVDNWRELILENPQIVKVTGGGKKNPKVWQFKAHEDAELFLRNLEITWNASKSAVLETALRWALQKPAEIWTEPAELQQWIEANYGFTQVELGELLYRAEQFSQRQKTLKLLEGLAEDGRIRLSYAHKEAIAVHIGHEKARTLQLIDHKAHSNLPPKWESVADLLGWIAHRYEDKQIPVVSVIDDVRRYKFTSESEAIALLEQAVKEGWLATTDDAYEGSAWTTLLGQGYRALQLSHPVSHTCSTYELRDCMSRGPSNIDRQKLLTPIFRKDAWMAVRWRSKTLGYAVNPGVAQIICDRPEAEIDVSELGQVAFFKQFTQLVRDIRRGDTRSVQFTLKGGDQLVLFAPVK